MIESRELFPGLCRVARLTSGYYSISPHFQHAFLELPLMGIFVAARAAQILPMIDFGRLRLELARLFVTIATSYRNVAAGENEVSILVPRQREGGWLVAVEIVATITRIEKWGTRELSAMPIGVAIRAALKFDFEKSVSSPWYVTLCALNFRVPTLQRVGGGRVLLRSEGGGFPSLHGVTPGALSTARPFHKLPVVRVGLMAIGALLKRQRLLKVTAAMALDTTHVRVLPQQRVLGFGMIEELCDRRRRDFFPAARVVAGLTALSEASFVRIGVTVRALIERDTDISRLVIRSRRMTLLASDLRV